MEDGPGRQERRAAGGGHRLVLASSRIFQMSRCMQALASSLELCPSTVGGHGQCPAVLRGGGGGPAPTHPDAPRWPPALTVVLDDLPEAVGHQIAQGALVRQAQAVREQHRRVHHGAVDDLWEGRTQGRAGWDGAGRARPGSYRP